MMHKLTSNAGLTSELLFSITCNPAIAETSIPLLAAYEICVAQGTQDRQINDETPLDSSFNPTRHTEMHCN